MGKVGEGLSLSNIGSTREKQQQPELAIVFYKQSVNVREGIRQDLRKLPREQQESYTQTVADTYRSLADLLLSQGRVLEAQQPLEGEIKDKNVRNLVFSLDRSTRYIPMAALFNGKQYLIERYGISTILNAGLTDVKDRLPSKKQDIKVLAMGVSKAFPGFNALSNHQGQAGCPSHKIG